MEAFTFSISLLKSVCTIPGQTVLNFIFNDLHSFSNEDFDFFIMHQANLKMNKMISKKLKVDDNKVLYSINEFGNTSSLSIPLTLTVNRHLLTGENLKILCCGFGVGLSWGSALLNVNDKTIYKNILYV